MPLPLGQYRRLVDAAPTLIWRAGVDGACDFFNQTWLAFTGRDLEQEVGVGWLDGVHPDDAVGCAAHYAECFAARRPFEMEYRLRRHDGAYRWILDRGAPFYGADGAFAGYIGHCVDVHERRTADQAKATFLAMLAHDLRSPLQTLVLAADQVALAAERGVPTPGPAAQRLRRQVSRLRQIVDRSTRGIEATLEMPAALVREPVDPIRLTAAAIEAHREMCRDRNPFEASWSGQPRDVALDVDEFSHVLDILFDNAVKYSPPGSPIAVRGTFADQGLTLEVLDQGIGVVSDDLPRLGTPFFRGSALDPTEYPGLGIGLAIARRAVRAHGGELTLEPRTPRGTRVVAVFPDTGP